MPRYVTEGGVAVQVETAELEYTDYQSALFDALDQVPGIWMCSNYEYPGRYSRWDLAVIDPPLVITGARDALGFQARSEKGAKLLEIIASAVVDHPHVAGRQQGDGFLRLEIMRTTEPFPEDQRSKQPSYFSVLRAVIDLLKSEEDGSLGLYGAFGYDMVFQFESIERHLDRADDQRDLVLFLPDQIYTIDHYRQEATLRSYDFSLGDVTTQGASRDAQADPFKKENDPAFPYDHDPGEFAKIVRVAKESFKKGDLFEVVPGQTFFKKMEVPPSEIFRRVLKSNPAPYSFFANLGGNEFLVGASPEMFVRVSGTRVETCPISGTIARGGDAISDSEQILKLLSSKKDESELTMCTDVDRNDKARVCVPGSIRVIGRRQIETYSKLYHTVDHVEGRLADGYDALDAFLTHMWAVTVTGAPKLWAMRFIESHEKSPRRWYGGAVGALNFTGDINTGLTLRTIRIAQGVAEVRAGATLLFDSDPDAEEEETRLKASAFLRVLESDPEATAAVGQGAHLVAGAEKLNALIIDCEDSFVHMLTSYFAATGLNVKTLRYSAVKDEDVAAADFIIMSPGPGAPDDFETDRFIKQALDLHKPLFGVCLGFQAIAKYHGAPLDLLDEPMHGKPSEIEVASGWLLDGVDTPFTVGRYHSIHVKDGQLQGPLRATALTDDGVIMAFEHESLPVAAVQFHPESIMSLGQQAGQRIVENMVRRLISES